MKLVLDPREATVEEPVDRSLGVARPLAEWFDLNGITMGVDADDLKDPVVGEVGLLVNTKPEGFHFLRNRSDEITNVMNFF
jgi:hypothetical protein